jgi:3-methyladenine DNA glycosylase Tag
MKKKCPQKEAIERGIVVARKQDATTGADEDAYHEKLREEIKKAGFGMATIAKKRRKIVNFWSFVGLIWDFVWIGLDPSMEDYETEYLLFHIRQA